MVGVTLSQFKTILSESRNFSGNAQLQSACQHVGIGWLLILAPDHDDCCEMCNIHWPTLRPLVCDQSPGRIMENRQLLAASFK
jgi:hypothetical protein